MNLGELKFTHLSRGIAWFDTGNSDALYDAATYVRVIQERTGLNVSCLEEIAFLQNWITAEYLISKLERMGTNKYANYIRNRVLV
jgi:glucose-1-phosphate thymidylyltransferase